MAENTTLVALTPAEMPAAQSELRGWLDRKIETVQQELAEAEENLKIAITRKWRQTAFRNLIARTKRLITYYEKLRVAVGEGFLIIPSMQCDVFAVRTERTDNNRGWMRSRQVADNVAAEALPVGEGQYVSPESDTKRVGTTNEEFADGEKYKQDWFIGTDLHDVAFPVSVIKPHVMDKTGQAMALKVFDEIGVVLPQGMTVRSRKADPFIVGRIRDPRQFRPPQTFFIAWWLDTRSL